MILWVQRRKGVKRGSLLLQIVFTLSELNSGIFHDEQKKASVRAGGRNLSLRRDRNLFACLLILGQGRQMDLRELLKHELGLSPWSLEMSDGLLAKTNQAVFSNFWKME